jgi:hypothetical protein
MKLIRLAAAPLALAGLVLLAPAPAEAGPVACIKAIAGCGKGTVKTIKAVKASRAACEALRDCKKVCRVDKRATKKDNKGDKKACISSCDRKKGKAKRQCKKSCRKVKRGGNQEARGVKRGCMDSCRAQYKTKACKKARRKLVATIAGEGLKCAATVAAGCATATP